MTNEEFAYRFDLQESEVLLLRRDLKIGELGESQPMSENEMGVLESYCEKVLGIKPKRRGKPKPKGGDVMTTEELAHELGVSGEQMRDAKKEIGISRGVLSQESVEMIRNHFLYHQGSDESELSGLEAQSDKPRGKYSDDMLVSISIGELKKLKASVPKRVTLSELEKILGE
jgi:DNA-binding Xre family transcriptional regulator